MCSTSWRLSVGLAVSRSASGISGDCSGILFAASALATPSLLKGNSGKATGFRRWKEDVVRLITGFVFYGIPGPNSFIGVSFSAIA